MAIYRDCEGYNRRDMLRVSANGFGLLGLRQAQGAIRRNTRGKDRAAREAGATQETWVA